VISSYHPPFKKSLRSELLIPRAVVIDPQLTVSNSKAVTAASGMDAITQLIESYISRRAKPIPRALARQGLGLALAAIEAAVEDGSSRPAREAMAHAALLSGMALANSGLGMAHGVAAALGVHFHVSHGLACAVMLPVALRVNREVCEEEFAELALAVGIEAESCRAVDRLFERIEQICHRVGVSRRLAELGVRREHLAVLVRDSRGNSMDGNPRSLSDEQLFAILEAQL
jgi:alcohol dehydrogenase class IV